MVGAQVGSWGWQKGPEINKEGRYHDLWLLAGNF